MLRSTSQSVADHQATQRLNPLALSSMLLNHLTRLALPRLHRREAVESLMRPSVVVERTELIQRTLECRGARQGQALEQRLERPEEALDPSVLPRVADLDEANSYSRKSGRRFPARF
jgi:hypothetical protein